MGGTRTEWWYEIQEIPRRDMDRNHAREVLRQMGSSFWELVSVVRTEDSYLLIFKRPRTDRE